MLPASASELFRRVAVRRRAPGQRIAGRWVPGAVAERLVLASVQPARPQEVAHLPEGTRTRAAVAVWSDEAIRPGDEAAGVEADRVVHSGFEWEAQQVERHEHGLAHWKSVCVRAETPLEEPAAPALAPPVLLSAMLAPGGVRLAWSASPGALRYAIERAWGGAAAAGTAAGGSEAVAAEPASRLAELDYAARMEVAGVSALDPGHPRGGWWTYRVSAVSAAATSLPSNAIRVNVP